MLSRDGWGGLVALAASLSLFALTLELKDNPLVPIGPGFYPRIVLGISALLAAGVVIADWRRRGGRREADPANYRLVAAMFALFTLYVGALPYLGFRVATFVYVAGTNALLDPPHGATGWLRAAAVALVTTVVVYFVFERYLSVLMPRGRWTGF